MPRSVFFPSFYKTLSIYSSHIFILNGCLSVVPESTLVQLSLIWFYETPFHHYSMADRESSLSGKGQPKMASMLSQSDTTTGKSAVVLTVLWWQYQILGHVVMHIGLFHVLFFFCAAASTSTLTLHLMASTLWGPCLSPALSKSSSTTNWTPSSFTMVNTWPSAKQSRRSSVLQTPTSIPPTNIPRLSSHFYANLYFWHS